MAFPAERKALIEVCRDTRFRGEGLLGLSGVHFLRLLRVIERPQRLDLRPGAKAIADILEERILNGRVVPEETLAGARWVYQSRRGGRFEMPASSSLVRSLGAFDAYIRSFAASGDLIVIDEPEMNLHPAAQLMLAEVLGLLVHGGVNIVLTTHSPYIVDHVNNLVEAGSVPAAKRAGLAQEFKLRKTEAFLDESNVAAYLFAEDGRVSPIFNRETRIIDWSTFGAVSEEMTNLHPEIYSAAE